MELAIAGCGNLGGALLRGVLAAGYHRPDEVLIYHPDPARAVELAAQFGVAGTAELTDLGEIPRLLLAVKPAKIEDLLGELEGSLRPGQLLISVAAGWSLSGMQTILARPDLALVRAMPNTPVQIGAGVTPWCASAAASTEQRTYAEALFATVGQAMEVDEGQMDALTALAGSGPAYVCLVLEAMTDAAVREGVPRALASRVAAATLEGTARLARETGREAAALRAQVTSPGGTTAAGLAELERHGLRAAFLDALAAAAARSRSLGR